MLGIVEQCIYCRMLFVGEVWGSWLQVYAGLTLLVGFDLRVLQNTDSCSAKPEEL